MEIISLTQEELYQSFRLGFIQTPIGRLYMTKKIGESLLEIDNFPHEVSYSLAMILESKDDYEEPDFFELFQYPQFWTDDLKSVLEEMQDDWDDTYDNCAKLVEKLESIGYTCDYYLTAEPFNLRIKGGIIYDETNKKIDENTLQWLEDELDTYNPQEN